MTSADRKPRVHCLKPLPMRRLKMHAFKVHEPRDAERWTLVESDYDLGTAMTERGSKALRAGTLSRYYFRAYLLPLIAGRIVHLHGATHAREQFIRSKRLYQIAHHLRSDRLRLRPRIRICGHENGGDSTIRGDQTLV